MDGSGNELGLGTQRVGNNAIQQLGESALLFGYTDEHLKDSPGYQLLEQIQNDCAEVEIREEQVDALNALYYAKDGGESRALIQMATGLGKTTVVAADVRRHLEDNPDGRVLVLCHQNRILDQLRERFERILGPHYSYGNFTGEGAKDYHKVTCLFASLQAMTDWHKAFLKNEFSYEVVDESQHSMAETFKPTITYFKPQFLLGVTGTPDRHDLQDIRDIYGSEKYTKPLEEAIAEGKLTDTEYYVIIDELEAQKVLKDNNGQRFNRKQLNRSVFAPMRDEEMAKICNEKAAELKQLVRRLVFCESIEHTEEFAQYFTNAEPIHSKLPKWKVKELLDKFRNGEIETLLTVDMFNEGIDVPEINQVVFARITQSKTIFLQQLGRGLRKIFGKDKVQVLDFVANADRLTMLDRFWKRIKEHKGSESQQQESFRINIGDTQFSETLRDVLDILADIESSDSSYKNWTPEDSIIYYRKLSGELGRPAEFPDLIRARKTQGGPPYNTVLKPFDNRIKLLRRAAGYDPEGLDYDKWGPEDYISYYQKLSEKLGRPAELTDIADVGKKGGPPKRRVLEYFNSSILELREAAGLSWTRENAIAYYQKLCGQLGKIATGNDIVASYREKKGPSVRTLIIPFEGRLPALREAAGVQIDYNHWGHDDIVGYYQSLSKSLGHPASGKDIAKASKNNKGPSLSYINSHFGKISEIRTAAGFKPIGYQHWGHDDFITYYREVSEELGHPATKGDLESWSKDKRGPSVPIVLGEFEGRVSFLKQAAGYSENAWDNWSEEDYISYYQSISTELGRPATQTELKKAAQDGRGPGEYNVSQRFEGSLLKLRRAAGYDLPADYSAWSDQDFVDYYTNLTENIGLPATIRDITKAFKDGTGPSMDVIRARFKDLRSLRAAAGLKRDYTKEWTEDDYIEFYRRVSSVTGRPATAKEIDSLRQEVGGGPSSGTIIRVFTGGILRLRNLTFPYNR